jgi:hypothetical protein
VADGATVLLSWMPTLGAIRKTAGISEAMAGAIALARAVFLALLLAHLGPS